MIMIRAIIACSLLTVAACATPPPSSTTWPSDPIDAVIARVEMCVHWGGEEPYDAERRVEIERGIKDAGCDTVVADGEALKATHPADAARIEAALADFRP